MINYRFSFFKRLQNFFKFFFQILNVSCNKLTSLRGLESNTELIELNLSGNQLTELGPQIIDLTKLKVLKLSGNQFESVVQLDRLRVIHLNEVELADKLYPLAPLCQLTNYRLQMIYTLQSLEVYLCHKLSIQKFKQLYSGSQRGARISRGRPRSNTNHPSQGRLLWDETSNTKTRNLQIPQINTQTVKQSLARAQGRNQKLAWRVASVSCLVNFSTSY